MLDTLLWLWWTHSARPGGTQAPPRRFYTFLAEPLNVVHLPSAIWCALMRLLASYCLV